MTFCRGLSWIYDIFVGIATVKNPFFQAKVSSWDILHAGDNNIGQVFVEGNDLSDLGILNRGKETSSSWLGGTWRGARAQLFGSPDLLFQLNV